MRHGRRSLDPKWMDSRYPGKCSKCGDAIKKGQRIFYYPATKAVYCEICGKDAASDFSANVFDEAQYNGGF